MAPASNDPGSVGPKGARPSPNMVTALTRVILRGSLPRLEESIMHQARAALVAAILVLLAGTALASAQAQAPSKTPAVAVLNINTATADQLDALPGIGAKMAARIVEYRQKNGAFKKVEDLMNIRGIGEKNFLKLKPLITVGAKAAPSEPGQ